MSNLRLVRFFPNRIKIKKFWILLLLPVVLAACSEDSPTSVEVEVSMPKIPAPPYMGKNVEFYMNTPDAFHAMRSWCKEYVDAVRTDPQSKECGTVGHVYRIGGPKG